MTNEQKGHAARYWKLDAMRFYFVNEIFSYEALIDVIHFVAWMVVGFALEMFLCSFSPPLKRGTEVWSLQWTAYVTMGILMSNWWLLGLGIGGVLSFVERDLQGNSNWKDCSNAEYLRNAYYTSQRLAQILCPTQVAWMVVVANALNRQCDLVPHIPENWSYKWFAWTFCGRDLERESLIWPRAKIRREVHLHISCCSGSQEFNFQGEISLGFAKKSCCSDSSDSDSESEDSVQPEDTERRAQGDDKKDFVLIYSAQGEHVEGHGKLVYNTDDSEDDAILKCTNLSLDLKELNSATWKKIEKAYHAKTALLVHYGRGTKGRRFHSCPEIYETVPGKACASITIDKAKFGLYMLIFLLVAFLAFMFLEKLLFGNRGIEGGLTDFSIYLLLSQ